MHLMKMLEELKRKGMEGEYGEELELLFKGGEKKLKFMEHEYRYGPHFNEEFAQEAVREMENEDGSKGPRWSLEETTRYAEQYGINIREEKYNKYDWFVALNMMYSDYCKAVYAMTNSENVKYFIELAKAWIGDKDAPEGKTWLYFVNIMSCEEEEEDEELSRFARGRRGRRRRGRGRSRGRMAAGRFFEEDEFEEDEEEAMMRAAYERGAYERRRPEIYDRVGNYYYRRY